MYQLGPSTLTLWPNTRPSFWLLWPDCGPAIDRELEWRDEAAWTTLGHSMYNLKGATVGLLMDLGWTCGLGRLNHGA